ARRQALISMQGVDRRKEECRDARGTRSLEDVGRDVRYAWRTFRRKPGFACTAVITVAFGVGINAVIFSVANAIAFRPLPVPDPANVFRVHGQTEHNQTRTSFSYPLYAAMRDGRPGGTDLAAYSPYMSPSVAQPGRPAETIRAFLVSENYFDVLRARPCLGRLLSAADARTRSVVLSHTFWKTHLAADVSAPGKQLMVNRQPYTIIGVACADFAGAEIRQPAAWLPLTQQAELEQGKRRLDDREARWLFVIGRTGPDSPGREEVRAALSGVAARTLQTSQPGESTRRVLFSTATFFPVFEDMIPLAALLLAPTLLVLLVACANLASVTLARGAARSREIAIRASLGASRGRIVRQLLTEALILSIAGGLAGAMAASFLLEAASAAIHSHALSGQFAVPDFSIDGRMLSFAVALSALTAVAFGLLPALAVTRKTVVPSRADASGTGHTGKSRSHRRLMAAQIAVCTVLLLAAALLLRSLQSALATQPGFEADRVVALRVHADAAGYDVERERLFKQTLSQRLNGLPGVTSVAQAQWTPLGDPDEASIALEGGAASAARYNWISAEFLGTLGIPVVAGRNVSAAEVDSNAPVALVSEAAAAAWWPGTSPLGKRVRLGQGGGGIWREVVGVVKDTRSIWLSRTDPAFVYLPGTSTSTFLIRTGTDVHSTRRAAVAQVGALDPAVATEAYPLGAVVQQWRLLPMGASVLASLIGGLGLALAAVGLFGTTAFLVGQRTREIGVRRALGGSASDILRLVLLQGLRPVIVGSASGLVLSLLLAHTVSGSFYGIEALDPLAITAVIAVLAFASMTAIAAPARRAMRVDPAQTLRQE
ncbi:MAG TPA: ADOP family duplicated permease, partial [Bryobacteraceae bacterium]|nr:ADOP family duplicated permease [Bryobacteraceae bacterium]